MATNPPPSPTPSWWLNAIIIGAISGIGFVAGMEIIRLMTGRQPRL